MTRRALLERVERLERLLEELGSASFGAPVLVEGARDAAALRELGVEGAIIELNKGQSLLRRCELLARSHKCVILLMDWDAKGRELQERLRRTLESCGGSADGRFWVSLRRLCGAGNRTVETLPSFLSELRSRAASAR